MSREAELPQSRPEWARGVYALGAGALGGLGIGEGLVVLAEFLDAGDLAIGDPEGLRVVEQHLAVSALDSRPNARVGDHPAVADLGHLPDLPVDPVDGGDPVLEVAADAGVAAVGAGVRGVLHRLPFDFLREELEPAIKLTARRRAGCLAKHLADQPHAGALGHRDENLLRARVLPLSCFRAWIR